MNDGLPTERQLIRIEQRVLDRIERRRAARTRLISAAAVAALVVGAVVLVRPLVRMPGTAAGSGASGGGSAGSAALVHVRCHAGGDPSSPVILARVPAHPDAASVAAACARAAGRPEARVPASAFVPCRSADGGWDAFRTGAPARAVCTRNGMKTG